MAYVWIDPMFSKVVGQSIPLPHDCLLYGFLSYGSDQNQVLCGLENNDLAMKGKKEIKLNLPETHHIQVSNAAQGISHYISGSPSIEYFTIKVM